MFEKSVRQGIRYFNLPMNADNVQQYEVIYFKLNPRGNIYMKKNKAHKS